MLLCPFPTALGLFLDTLMCDSCCQLFSLHRQLLACCFSRRMATAVSCAEQSVILLMPPRMQANNSFW